MFEVLRECSVGVREWCEERRIMLSVCPSLLPDFPPALAGQDWRELLLAGAPTFLASTLAWLACKNNYCAPAWLLAESVHLGSDCG